MSITRLNSNEITTETPTQRARRRASGAYLGGEPHAVSAATGLRGERLRAIMDGFLSRLTKQGGEIVTRQVLNRYRQRKENEKKAFDNDVRNAIREVVSFHLTNDSFPLTNVPSELLLDVDDFFGISLDKRDLAGSRTIEDVAGAIERKLRNREATKTTYTYPEGATEEAVRQNWDRTGRAILRGGGIGTGVGVGHAAAFAHGFTKGQPIRRKFLATGKAGIPAGILGALAGMALGGHLVNRKTPEYLKPKVRSEVLRGLTDLPEGGFERTPDGKLQRVSYDWIN